jgi:FkbM family methyltransferase
MERPFRTVRPLSELLVDNILHWLVSKIRTRARRIGDFPNMSVQIDDVIGVRIISTGRFELTQFDAIRYLFTNPPTDTGIPIIDGVFIDIGANVGTYSVGLSELFRRVIAFEPHPVAFKLLEANVALNDITNVSCVNMAVSDKSGQANLHVPRNLLTGGATLNHDLINRREKSLLVNMDLLDNIALTYEFADSPVSN